MISQWRFLWVSSLRRAKSEGSIQMGVKSRVKWRLKRKSSSLPCWKRKAAIFPHPI